jgi:5'-nucleotidase
MRILLTNDDGLDAPGILALYNALADLPIRGHPNGRFHGPLRAPAPHAATPTQILTIAPLTVQSATSHGVTYRSPLMVSEEPIREGVTGIAVDGRPADCVKLAIANLWPDRFPSRAGEPPSRPDLVVSGMNAGANVGINVIYSGTVAAAIEAAFLGIPSIAVSLRLGRGRPRFDAAAAFARRTIERLIADGLPSPHECLSINIPVTEFPPDFKDLGPGATTELPPEPRMPEIKLCPMNTHGLVDKYERRTAPSGHPYYWPTGHGLDFHRTEPGSDVDDLMRGCITVTPLHYDLTRHADLARWRERIL